jgi:hypothetical protein
VPDVLDHRADGDVVGEIDVEALPGWGVRRSDIVGRVEARRSKMNAHRIAKASVALLALSCSGESSGPGSDLPPGWSNAKSVASFSQASCGGSPLDPAAPQEAIDVTATTGLIHVAYHHAHFRCEQAVEGFVRTGSKTVDFLVQPTDMNPSSVAACDCLYEITMTAAASAGPTTVTVYRRWDHLGGNPINPVEVGATSVTVP